MSYFINLIFIIGAIQGTPSKSPWYERIVIGLAEFFGVHFFITYIFGPQRNADFFTNIANDYIIIFDSPSQPAILAIICGFLALMSFSIRNFHK